MNASEFEARLRADGFTEVLTAARQANESLSAHAHDYEVRALVLEGDITLTCDGETRTYRAGDTFSMGAGRSHLERVGESGVRYVVGRKR
jgi:quercetin dioxygenase-like cupin family protein